MGHSYSEKWPQATSIQCETAKKAIWLSNGGSPVKLNGKNQHLHVTVCCHRCHRWNQRSLNLASETVAWLSNCVSPIILTVTINSVFVQHCGPSQVTFALQKFSIPHHFWIKLLVLETCSPGRLCLQLQPYLPLTEANSAFWVPLAKGKGFPLRWDKVNQQNVWAAAFLVLACSMSTARRLLECIRNACTDNTNCSGVCLYNDNVCM